MADVAQLVRALVCGTKCRRFESGHPPQNKKGRCEAIFFILRKDGMRTSEKAGRTAVKRQTEVCRLGDSKYFLISFPNKFIDNLCFLCTITVHEIKKRFYYGKK